MIVASKRDAVVVDLTAEAKISPPPPLYQPSFLRNPEPPTVLSDDEGHRDPGEDMDWEDGPYFSGRNDSYDRRAAPGPPPPFFSA